MNYKYERLPDSDITATIPTTTHDNRQPVFEYHSIFQYSKSSQITLNDTEDGTAVYVGEEEVSMEQQTKVLKVMSTLFIILSYILVFVTAPVSMWFCVKSLNNWERLVIFRLGRFQGVKGPGFVLLLPFMDKCQKIDMRMKAFSIPPQQLITVDGAIIEIGADVHFRVINPAFLALNIQDYQRSLRTLGKIVLLNVLCSKPLSTIEKEKKFAAGEIQEHLNKQGHSWGLEVGSVELSVVKVLKNPEPPSVAPLLNAFGIKPDKSASQNTCEGHASTSTTDSTTTCRKASKSVRSMLEALLQNLDRVDAENVDQKVYKFTVVAEEAIVYFLKVGSDAQLLEGEQTSLQPDVAVTIGLDDFCAVMKGTLPPLQAYINGKLTVQGNVQLLMQLEKSFSKTTSPYEMFTV